MRRGNRTAASPSALSAAIYEFDAGRWRWSPWILGRQMSWDQVQNPTSLIPMEGWRDDGERKLLAEQPP